MTSEKTKYDNKLPALYFSSHLALCLSGLTVTVWTILKTDGNLEMIWNTISGPISAGKLSLSNIYCLSIKISYGDK